MRIMLIYERAVTLFKGDLGLWLQFIQYCRSRSTSECKRYGIRRFLSLFIFEDRVKLVNAYVIEKRSRFFSFCWNIKVVCDICVCLM